MSILIHTGASDTFVSNNITSSKKHLFKVAYTNITSTLNKINFVES